MAASDRIQSAQLRRKIMAAEDAAALIPPAANVGMSGFTGAGHPKAVPAALAARIKSAASAGRRFRLGVWTGAATAPDLTGALAQVEGIELLLPYQGDPVTRREINSGRMGYLDVQLSHVAPLASQGSLGRLDFAVIEAVGVTSDGDLIPSTSVGNNKTWIDLADQVIVEINAHQSAELDGLHDIYYGTEKPPHRTPIPITAPGDRIGVPHLRCPARSPRSCGPTPRTGASPSSHRIRSPRQSPATSSSSSTARSPRAACPATCCPCSPASATWPTRC
jgi:succinyl-CoA:acetate CoA-transferase